METTSKITLGGKDYEVAALTFGQLEEILPRVSGLATKLQASGGFSKEVIGDCLETIAAALKRKHPTMTAAHLRDEVTSDLTEMMEAVKVISELSGLKGEKPGAPGKPESLSGGAASTPTA